MKDFFPDDYDERRLMDGYITVKKPKPKKGQMMVDLPLKADFESWEEFEELRDEIDQRMAFVRSETYDLERKSAWLQERSDDLDEMHTKLAKKTGELEDWERSLFKIKERLDDRDLTLNADHRKLELVTSRLEAANRQPLDVINDVLLQLELEVDPIEIAKHIREIGKTLDVKW